MLLLCHSIQGVLASAQYMGSPPTYPHFCQREGQNNGLLPHAHQSGNRPILEPFISYLGAADVCVCACAHSCTLVHAKIHKNVYKHVGRPQVTRRQLLYASKDTGAFSP